MEEDHGQNVHVNPNVTVFPVFCFYDEYHMTYNKFKTCFFLYPGGGEVKVVNVHLPKCIVSLKSRL